MTCKADLTGADRVKHIGYLARGHSYTKGTTSETFFDHLVALVERPLGAWAGYHNYASNRMYEVGVATPSSVQTRMKKRIRGK
ncbi:MAG TPA: hypothetical protein VMU26_07875 [Candidatus Polarisedimenticolia bacterium]|nr:hypothetical protein [Candidatus Polarisedimenticolia bacterium]